jgi:hypothetical protein
VLSSDDDMLDRRPHRTAHLEDNSPRTICSDCAFERLSFDSNLWFFKIRKEGANHIYQWVDNTDSVITLTLLCFLRGIPVERRWWHLSNIQRMGTNEACWCLADEG